MRLSVFASGSKGNCSIIEDTATGECAAIDCGISKRAFMQRCAECGFDPVRIEAILVTHEHSDHVKGMGVVTRGLAKLGVHPTLFASDAVRKASSELRKIENDVDFRCFSADEDLSLAGMSVHTFRTLHDAAESFGFRFDCQGDSLGFMTDTGVVTGQAREALASARLLAIEANHDLDMLATGPYPQYLKERIASDHGHLSNEQSASLLEELLDNALEEVVGMHVSENNNTYSLPASTLARVLQNHDHPANAHVAYQNKPISL